MRAPFISALLLAFLAGCGGQVEPSPALTSKEKGPLSLSSIVRRPVGHIDSMARSSAKTVGLTHAILNGDFENGLSPWISVNQVIFEDPEIAYEGRGFAWLGGNDDLADDLWQEFYIPSNAVNVTLEFQLAVDTREQPGIGVYDTMTVEVVDAATGALLEISRTFSNQDAKGAWVRVSDVDLTKYKGRKVRLVFFAQTDSSSPTHFLLDNIKVQAHLNDSLAVKGSRKEFTTLLQTNGSLHITHAATKKTIVYKNVKQVFFDDGALSYDMTGAEARLFRLYQAAFDRSPDVAGLGYWILVQQSNAMSLAEIAEQFMNSAEFRRLYGEPQNDAFIDLMYYNVLHRNADAAGHAFHLANLNRGAATRRDLLLAFSDSTENIAQVAPRIAQGFEFTLPEGASAKVLQTASLPQSLDFLQDYQTEITVPVWPNCPSGYEVMRAANNAPITHGGGACVKKFGQAGVSGPSGPGGGAEPSNPANPGPGGGTGPSTPTVPSLPGSGGQGPGGSSPGGGGPPGEFNYQVCGTQTVNETREVIFDHSEPSWKLIAVSKQSRTIGRCEGRDEVAARVRVAAARRIQRAKLTLQSERVACDVGNVTTTSKFGWECTLYARANKANGRELNREFPPTDWDLDEDWYRANFGF